MKITFCSPPKSHIFHSFPQPFEHNSTNSLRLPSTCTCVCPHVQTKYSRSPILFLHINLSPFSLYSTMSCHTISFINMATPSFALSLSFSNLRFLTFHSILFYHSITFKLCLTSCLLPLITWTTDDLFLTSFTLSHFTHQFCTDLWGFLPKLGSLYSGYTLQKIFFA